MRLISDRVVAVAFVLRLIGPAAADPGDQIIKLFPDDPKADQYFGTSVSICESGILVGTYAFPADPAAYLFDYKTYKQNFKLIPGESAGGFGRSVALGVDSNYALVGAYLDDDLNYTGSVFVFDTITGNRLRKLYPEDPSQFKGFGQAVAMWGSLGVIGVPNDTVDGQSSGSAYLFNLDTGKQIVKVRPHDGKAYKYFGFSVAIGPDRFVVGAYGDDEKAPGQGAAYVFDFSGWEVNKVFADDGAQYDGFGWSIAQNADSFVVGAPGRDSLTGEAYLFDSESCLQITSFVPYDGVPGDNFGWSVGLGDETAVVGAATSDEDGTDAGGAYVCALRIGGEVKRIKPLDLGAGYEFGYSTAVYEGYAVMGAVTDPENGPNAGSAYLFDAGSLSCYADFDGNGSLNLFDFLGFVNAFNDENPKADCDGDGGWTLFDMLCYTNSFNGGC